MKKSWKSMDTRESIQKEYNLFKFDLISYNIDYKLDNGIIVIVNSCDGVVHLVITYYNRIILTQSNFIITSNIF